MDTDGVGQKKLDEGNRHLTSALSPVEAERENPAPRLSNTCVWVDEVPSAIAVVNLEDDNLYE
jgi:hypothetical protein